MHSLVMLAVMELILIPNCSLLSNDVNCLTKFILKKKIAINIMV